MNTENLSAFMRKEEEKLINRTKKNIVASPSPPGFPSLQNQPIKTRRLTSHRKKKKESERAYIDAGQA